MAGAIHESKQGLMLAVHVVPRSAKERIAGIHGGALRIQLSAPPSKGAANAALVDLLARTLGIAKSQLTIVSGHASRRKLLSVSGLSRQTLERRLGHILEAE